MCAIKNGIQAELASKHILLLICICKAKSKILQNITEKKIIQTDTTTSKYTEE